MLELLKIVLYLFATVPTSLGVFSWSSVDKPSVAEDIASGVASLELTAVSFADSISQHQRQQLAFAFVLLTPLLLLALAALRLLCGEYSASDSAIVVMRFALFSYMPWLADIVSLTTSLVEGLDAPVAKLTTYVLVSSVLGIVGVVAITLAALFRTDGFAEKISLAEWVRACVHAAMHRSRADSHRCVTAT